MRSPSVRAAWSLLVLPGLVLLLEGATFLASRPCPAGSLDCMPFRRLGSALSATAALLALAAPFARPAPARHGLAVLHVLLLLPMALVGVLGAGQPGCGPIESHVGDACVGAHWLLAPGYVATGLALRQLFPAQRAAPSRPYVAGVGLAFAMVGGAALVVAGDTRSAWPFPVALALALAGVALLAWAARR